MKLKLDADGHVVVTDGKPVYVKDDGSEMAFDAPGTIASISRLNGEAKTNRERAEAAEKAYKPFEGFDPDATRKALETTANLDAKKLVDIGEVERVRADALSQADAKYAPIVQKAEKLEAELYAAIVGGSFAGSKFIAENLAIPSDIAQSAFGGRFKVEDGAMVAYRTNGERIMDPGNPAKAAGFEDALKVIVNEYPNRDNILKGSGAQGSGASGAGGANGGGRSISRAEFSKLAPAAQATAARDASITITD